MKALIIGNYGFIGSSLAKRLTENQWGVYGIDSREILDASSRDKDSRYFHHYLLGSYKEDSRAIANKFFDTEVIFYCASPDVSAVSELIQIAKELPNLKKVVLLTTYEAGGSRKEGWGEEFKYNPETRMAAEAAASEMIALGALSQLDIPFIFVRVPDVFGFGMGTSEIIPIVATSVVRGFNINLGNNEMVTTREWVHIDYLCASLCFIGSFEAIPPKTILNIKGVSGIGSSLLAYSVAGIAATLCGNAPLIVKQTSEFEGVEFSLSSSETKHFLSDSYSIQAFNRDLYQTVFEYVEGIKKEIM